MRRNKFNNKRVTLDGIAFDSIKESRRYCDLRLLEKEREIHGLECHPYLPIVISGVSVCRAEADFSYWEKNKRVFEDVKGKMTPMSSLKAKLVRACFPGIDSRIIK